MKLRSLINTSLLIIILGQISLSNADALSKSKKEPSLKTKKQISRFSTDIRFDDQVVKGKYRNAYEAQSIIENEKELSDIIEVRKNFKDRIKVSENYKENVSPFSKR